MSSKPASPEKRFEALYRMHHSDVLRFALRRADPATAEDVANETFAICWRRLQHVPPSAPLPWLYTTARYELLARRRSADRADEKARRFSEGTALTTRDPSDALAERSAIVEAFAALDPKDRETLVLLAWDGLSTHEAARVLGITRPAFAMRLSRARRRLRAALQTADDPSLIHNATEVPVP